MENSSKRLAERWKWNRTANEKQTAKFQTKADFFRLPSFLLNLWLRQTLPLVRSDVLFKWSGLPRTEIYLIYSLYYLFSSIKITNLIVFKCSLLNNKLMKETSSLPNSTPKTNQFQCNLFTNKAAIRARIKTQCS